VIWINAFRGVALQLSCQPKPHLYELSARTALEEAHHLLPVTLGHAPLSLPQRLGGTVLITVHLDHVAPEILSSCWLVQSGQDPFAMHPARGKAERIRHLRKYAVGDLKDQSFRFRGLQEKHCLRAPNLSLFCNIGRGIDEETRLFHLHRGDYSRWIRESVKGNDLGRRRTTSGGTR
jgi:hypothetical protein